MAPSDSPPPQGASDLRGDVIRARSDARFIAGLRETYRQVDLDVGRQNTSCRACGDCCRFDRTDHRLYVSTGELALLTAAAPAGPRSVQPLHCPYQDADRCRARDRRPLGCRVFFCDEDLQAWSRDSYERFHRLIRRLHDEARLPYAYIEMTAGAAEVLSGIDAGEYPH